MKVIFSNPLSRELFCITTILTIFQAAPFMLISHIC